MSISAIYSKPNQPLPAKGTLLADVIMNAPTQGFVNAAELCRRVGKPVTGMRSIISTAVRRELLKTEYPRRSRKQGYRLTVKGREAKQHYLTLES